MQRVNHLDPIVTHQAPAMHLVRYETSGAVIRERLNSTGIFMRQDVRVAEARCHGTARANSVSPRQVKILSCGLHVIAGRYGDVSLFNPVQGPHVPELDVVVVAAIAIHSAAKRLATSPSLHPATAGFAHANVTDAYFFG